MTKENTTTLSDQLDSDLRQHIQENVKENMPQLQEYARRGTKTIQQMRGSGKIATQLALGALAMFVLGPIIAWDRGNMWTGVIFMLGGSILGVTAFVFWKNKNTIYLTLAPEGFKLAALTQAIPWELIENIEAETHLSPNNAYFTLAQGCVPVFEAKKDATVKFDAQNNILSFRLDYSDSHKKPESAVDELYDYWNGAKARKRIAELNG